LLVSPNTHVQELREPLDDLLRGRLTREEHLAQGHIDVPPLPLVQGSLLIGAINGALMGLFAALRAETPSVLHLFATTFKVPLLFLLPLVVTYPSLYVVSALFESKLKPR